MDLIQMQNLVNHIFSRLGIKTSLVFVKPTNSTIAAAAGIKLNEVVSIFGLSPPAVGGFVYVNIKFLNKFFTDSEIYFILAHECSHIFHNHLVNKFFWNMLETTLKGEKNENYELVEIIKFGFVLLGKNHLPPNAENLREQEYESDKTAVQITGDLNSSISCLSKLSNNDQNLPSHTWELFNNQVPAMSMKQRIEALRTSMNFV